MNHLSQRRVFCASGLLAFFVLLSVAYGLSTGVVSAATGPVSQLYVAGSGFPTAAAGWKYADGTGSRGEPGLVTGFQSADAPAVPYCDLVINLQAPLPAGTYTTFAKVLYGSDPAPKMSFLLGGVEQTATVPSKEASDWWTSGTTFDLTAPTSTLTIRVYNTLATDASASAQYYTLLGAYVTDNANERVMQDNTVVDVHFPTASEMDDSTPIKGNYLPGGSFETGPGGGWSLNMPATSVLASMFDTSTAALGATSMRLPLADYSKQLISPIFHARPNRQYTVSVYLKGSSAFGVDVSVVNAYAFDPGVGTQYQVTNTFSVGTTWKRYSFSANLLKYPYSDYYVVISPRGNNWSSGYLWVDGVQVEEGSLTPYCAAGQLEVGAWTAQPGNVFGFGQPPQANLMVFNNTDSMQVANLNYRVVDSFGAQAASGSTTIAVGPQSPGNRWITLPISSTGHYTLLVSSPAPLPAVGEMQFAVLPPLYASATATRTMGAHVGYAPYAEDMAQRGGITLARTLSLGCQAFRWSLVEPVQGQYTWDDADVNNAVAHGETLLATLWDEPAWARDASGFPDAAAFEDYVFNTATHYRGKVKYYEVWNEPNQRSPQPIPPAAYADLLQRASRAIRAADPSAQVIAMGGSDPAYINSVMDALGGDASCFDAMSTHLYPSAENNSAAFLAIVARTGKPGFNTETGAKSAPDSLLQSYESNDTPYARANLDRSPMSMTQEILWNFAETMGTTVNGVSMSGYYYYDAGLRTAANFPFTFSLYDSDGTVRTKGIAYFVTGSLLDGAKGMGMVDLSTVARAGVFERDGQGTAMLRLNSPAQGELRIPLSAGTLRVLDVMGNTLPVSTAATYSAVPLGSSLVYVQLANQDATALKAALAAASVTVGPDTKAPRLAVNTPVTGTVADGRPLEVRVSANDNVGVDRVEFYVDGTMLAQDRVYPYAYTLDTSGLSLGAHTISVRAFDTAGNSDEQTVSIVRVGPWPTTTTSLDSAWHNGPVTVSLSATDALSGVASTYYRLGSDPTTCTYCVPFTVSSEGTTSIEYWSVDVAGNAETVKGATVRIDETAPQLSLDAVTTYVGTATINAIASDALSGLGRVEFALDGGPWSTGEQLSTNVPGNHTVNARAFDNAGNERDAHVTFTVFAPPPVVTTRTQLTGSSSAKVKKTLKLKGTISASVAPALVLTGMTSPLGIPGVVTITKTRLIGRKWRSAGSVKVGVVAGRFSCSFKPTSRGKWRFVATYSGSVVGVTIYKSSRSGIKGATVK